MNSDVCRELFHYLDGNGSLSVGHCSAKVTKWLDEVEFPWALRQMLRFYWPKKRGNIAHLRLCPSGQLPQQDYLQEFLAIKLLPIGCAPNGDPLVVRFDTDQCEIGFVSHERYFSTDKKTLDHLYQPIARTLDSLLYRIAEGKYVPTDFHAAKAFNEFLAEEKGGALQSSDT